MANNIWLDVDGVLLDYTRPFLDFTGLSNSITYANLDDYNLNRLFESEKKCQDAMLRFALSDEFHALPSIAHREDLEVLKNLGFSLRVITQLPAPAKAKLARIINLTHNFGAVFDEIVFTMPGQCKIEYIQERNFNVGDVLIEDNPNLLLKANTLAEEGTDVEVHAIWHPYNDAASITATRIPFYDNFAEVGYVLATNRLNKLNGSSNEQKI